MPASLFQNLAPHQRALLFYGVCVPLRTALAMQAPRLPRPALAALGGAGVLLNLRRLLGPGPRKWWNSEFQLLASAAVVALAASGADKRAIALVLLLSVAEGLTKSLHDGVFSARE